MFKAMVASRPRPLLLRTMFPTASSRRIPPIGQGAHIIGRRTLWRRSWTGPTTRSGKSPIGGHVRSDVPVEKTTFYTKAGDQICGVGYYMG